MEESDMLNHYERLGISQNANDDDIEAGYQNMLWVHHEEISADPKGLLWCFIQIARDTLLNEEKRIKYDRELAGNQSPAPAPAPIQPNPQVTRTNNPTAPQNPSTVSDGSDDLLRNVKTPVINWDDMQWFNRDYSSFIEKISTPQPGLKKGFFATTGFLIAIFLTAVYAGTFPFPQVKGFPLNGLFAIAVVVLWQRYYSWSWNKIKYLVGMGIFSIVSISSILFGEHKGSSIVPAIIVALVCAGATYLGIVGADNARLWVSINSSRRIIRKKLSNREIKSSTAWGIAGELDDAIDKFGAQAVALGAAGEKFTAEFMQELLKIPGTRIFHGLEFPGSFNADVDHAIINGDKIAFVDSKMWKAGNYSWEWDGVIRREDDTGTTKINTNFHHAVLGYKKRLPEAQIRSHILIYSASGRPVIIDNSNAERSKNLSDPVTEMITAQQFFEEIGDWFSEGKPGYINKNLVSALFSKLKI